MQSIIVVSHEFLHACLNAENDDVFDRVPVVMLSL